MAGPMRCSHSMAAISCPPIGLAFRSSRPEPFCTGSGLAAGAAGSGGRRQATPWDSNSAIRRAFSACKAASVLGSAISRDRASETVLLSFSRGVSEPIGRQSAQFMPTRVHRKTFGRRLAQRSPKPCGLNMTSDYALGIHERLISKRRSSFRKRHLDPICDLLGQLVICTVRRQQQVWPRGQRHPDRRSGPQLATGQIGSNQTLAPH